MKVILLQDVKKVGKKDQTVEVSDGFAANFLFPRHLAVQASKKSLEILDNQQEERRLAEEKAKAEAMELAKRLESVTLEFPVRCGKDGKMFGNISTKQVAEELENKFGIVVDKRKFVGNANVDALGYFKLKIELHKGVIGVINVHTVELGK